MKTNKQLKTAILNALEALRSNEPGVAKDILTRTLMTSSSKSKLPMSKSEEEIAYGYTTEESRGEGPTVTIKDLSCGCAVPGPVGARAASGKIGRGCRNCGRVIFY